jgi:hypothetical protein
MARSGPQGLPWPRRTGELGSISGPGPAERGLSGSCPGPGWQVSTGHGGVTVSSEPSGRRQAGRDAGTYTFSFKFRTRVRRRVVACPWSDLAGPGQSGHVSGASGPGHVSRGAPGCICQWTGWAGRLLSPSLALVYTIVQAVESFHARRRFERVAGTSCSCFASGERLAGFEESITSQVGVTWQCSSYRLRY